MTDRDPDALMTPAEVARVFRVTRHTVARWATAGRLTDVRALGGQRRYRQDEVRALLAGGSADGAVA